MSATKALAGAAAGIGAVCAIAGQGGAAAPAPASVPDTVYYHGRVYTVDDALGTQSAFAVAGDRIVAVGSDARVLRLAGKATRRVDLGGAAVIPGLTDSHDHLWASGRYLARGVDMVGVSTRAEFDARLRAAVAQAKPGEVVYTTTGWAVQPMPTRAELDAISAEVPIALIFNRRAIGMLNGAALRKLGITRDKPNWRGAAAPVDASGEPTGEIPAYPAGVQMIKVLLPPSTPALEDRLFQGEMAERNALGITSVRELALWPSGLAGLMRLRSENKLTVRFALGIEFPDSDNTIAQLPDLKGPAPGDPWLRIDSNSEEPRAGTMPPEQYTAFVRALNRLGWRSAPHVSASASRSMTTDGATEITLAAFEAADRDAPLDGKRWYIEHVPFATPAQMDRMAKLGLVVSVQDAGYAPAASAPMPPERMAHWNPVREFLDHKLVVIGGSDYAGPNPTTRTPNDPMIPFYFYVTRRNRAGQEVAPAEKVSRAEALRMFTANAAYATFQEKDKGRIAPGLLADFVILNQDLMTVPDDRIRATRPLATFVGGQRVYAAAGSRF